MIYTDWMKKTIKNPPADRIRAGAALSVAIDAAIDKGIITNYLDIAEALGFDRTNIPQHKAGTRPMNREVVLAYSEVLQCEPESIADDKVRMELARDLQRYKNDNLAYAVIREHEFTGNTPIKFPRDLLTLANVDPSQLVTVRINRSADSNDSDVVIVRADPDTPIISGVSHVLSDKGAPYVAGVVASGDGYIVTPEGTDKPVPKFYSKTDVVSARVIVIGQVFWRISRDA